MKSLIIVLLGLIAVGCSSSQAPQRPADSPAVTRSPAPISARVVLPSRTLAAGASLSGHVVIENNTGRAIRAAGCGSLFQLELVGRDYHPTVGWLTCLQTLTIPKGRSSYPVSIAASYNRCISGRPHGTTKACLPEGGPPALPPGVYRAVLFQVRKLVPAPPAISVRVTSRN